MEAYDNRLMKEIARVSGFLEQAERAIGTLEDIDEAACSSKVRQIALSRVADTVSFVNPREDVIGLATTSATLRSKADDYRHQYSIVNAIASQLVVPKINPNLEIAIPATSDAGDIIVNVGSQTKKLVNESRAWQHEVDLNLELVVTEYYRVHGNSSRLLSRHELISATEEATTYLKLLLTNDVIPPPKSEIILELINELQAAGIIIRSSQGISLI